MKEQLITLEVARLAKEKGYNPFKLDEKLTQAIISNGTHHYIDTRNIRTTSYYFYKEDDEKAECHEMRTGEMSSRYGRFDTVVEHYFGKETNSNYYHAPTQSLLQKWLRDVHNLMINIELFFNGAVEFAYNIYDLYDEKLIKQSFQGAGGSYEGTWYDYEQALEAGLLEALKLIEDEKV